MKPSSSADFFGSDGDEEVGASVRIDDGLEATAPTPACSSDGSPPPGDLAGRADEVSDRGDVGVEDLRGSGAAAVDGKRRRRRGLFRYGRRRRGRRRLRCRRRGAAGLERLEPRLERRDSAFVLLPQRRELSPQLDDFVALGRLLGGGLCPAEPACGAASRTLTASSRPGTNRSRRMIALAKKTRPNPVERGVPADCRPRSGPQPGRPSCCGFRRAAGRGTERFSVRLLPGPRPSRARPRRPRSGPRAARR